MDRIKQEE